MTSSFLDKPSKHYAPLQRLDVRLSFKAPDGIVRRLEEVLHMLRLKMAFTNPYLLQICIVETLNSLHGKVQAHRTLNMSLPPVLVRSIRLSSSHWYLQWSGCHR